MDYSGDWNGIALRSVTGHPLDLNSCPNVAYQNTALLDACAYFQEIISMFDCEMETIRLLRLAPGSEIKPHRDRGTGYQFGNFRLHIVIQTHADVCFMVDGAKVPMQAGECWYADFDCTHSVVNQSNEDRIHLVLDGLRNPWSDQLFARSGYDFSLEKTIMDDATFHSMIAELERMNTDTSRSLILKMKSERNGHGV